LLLKAFDWCSLPGEASNECQERKNWLATL
jgi:hypothetical protein